jgi:hypothetical protein
MIFHSLSNGTRDSSLQTVCVRGFHMTTEALPVKEMRA